MKPEDSREGLHTQGEWKIFDDGQIYPDSIFIGVKKNGKFTTPICDVTFGSLNENGKANAELICKAVNGYQQYEEDMKKSLALYNNQTQTIYKLSNERQKLLDSNHEMKNVLIELRNRYEKSEWITSLIDPVLNNAKNL